MILVPRPSHHLIFDLLKWREKAWSILSGEVSRIMTLMSALIPLDVSLLYIYIAIEQTVEMNISMIWFVNFSALSCVVQVETEEDLLSQAAFNQLEEKLK